jgi:hypothetical protein
MDPLVMTVEVRLLLLAGAAVVGGIVLLLQRLRAA